MGLTINVTYDSSVGSAPAGFKTAVTAAVDFLEHAFSNPVTINIALGYGVGAHLGRAIWAKANSMQIITLTPRSNRRSPPTRPRRTILRR